MHGVTHASRCGDYGTYINVSARRHTDLDKFANGNADSHTDQYRYEYTHSNADTDFDSDPYSNANPNQASANSHAPCQHKHACPRHGKFSTWYLSTRWALYDSNLSGRTHPDPES